MPLDRDDKEERRARLELLLEEAKRLRDSAADRLSDARAIVRHHLNQARASLTPKHRPRKTR